MERLHKRKLISLLCSFLVALNAGSNYGFSSYSPQLQERLHLTSTQINVVGMMGNMGVYLSGPLWGKLVDRRGPKRALAIGSVLIFVGYGGLSLLYEGRLLKTSSLFLLALLSLFTGLGNCAAFTAAMNAQAKSWHEERRGICTALVLSGFGLSAFFYSTLSHNLFPGQTGDYLLLLASLSSLSFLVGFFLIRVMPPHDSSLPHLSQVTPHSTQDTSESAPRTTYTRRRTSSDIGARAWGYVDPAQMESEEQSLASQSDEDTPHDEQQSLLQDGIDNRAPQDGVHKHAHVCTKASQNNLTGWALVRNADFILLFCIMTLISGTGLLVINVSATFEETIFFDGLRRTSVQ